ncbi:hypothetical protein PPERSA_08630 [Pseudocohnilembus persalinus]|uniref:Uncharacterized protein n=1 Tax=Pseudocohnilembus persalinus TaxID=266149 RepID=A0A0V0R551_PSEPJ|nr:hypothetical protein PPERSA_08630 [Pseudocohnilembus persalinus]|eukprot:KRX09598.1 hypothetical protein PPERSA_08630 [Pseudocohnilembus persalinus]
MLDYFLQLSQSLKPIYITNIQISCYEFETYPIFLQIFLEKEEEFNQLEILRKKTQIKDQQISGFYSQKLSLTLSNNNNQFTQNSIIKEATKRYTLLSNQSEQELTKFLENIKQESVDNISTPQKNNINMNCQTSCECSDSSDTDCGSDAITFQNCIIASTDNNCLTWNEFVLKLDDGDASSGVNYKYIEYMRLCYENCMNALISNTGLEFAQCQLDCHSNSLHCILSLIIISIVLLFI